MLPAYHGRTARARTSAMPSTFCAWEVGQHHGPEPRLSFPTHCLPASSERDRSVSARVRTRGAPYGQGELSRRLGRQPGTLTGQQFPGAALLLPDLQDRDLGIGRLAVGFAFRLPRVARDRIVADNGNGVTG